MSETHAPFCTEHEEGICRAPDVTAGKWEIGLVRADGETRVRPWHPEFLPGESAELTPAEAISLGRALILQGTRARGARPRLRLRQLRTRAARDLLRARTAEL